MARVRANLSAGSTSGLHDVATTTMSFVSGSAPGFDLAAGEYAVLAWGPPEAFDSPSRYDEVELVRLVGPYVAGATGGTIERAQEGSTALEHTAGHQWRLVPVASDFEVGNLDASMLGATAGDLLVVTDEGTIEAVSSGTYAPDAIVRAAAGLDNIVAYDTFNRDDGALGTSDSGHTWTVSSGPAAIASNKLACSSLSLAWIDPGEANHDVSVRVDPWGVTNAGLLVRGVDASNFLFFDLQATVAVLRKVVAGSFSNLSSVATPHASGDVVPIRVVARGPRIQCFRDGVRLIDHTLTGDDETTFASSTKVGIRANATFDDLVVRGA